MQRLNTLISSIKPATTAVLFASTLIAVRTASAQIQLTDADIVGCNSNGSYITANDWHTKSLGSGAWGLWLINGTSPNGAIIYGQNDGSGISLPVGTYTFTTLNAAIGPVSYYGLNLSFNNDPTSNPEISVYAPATTSTGATPAIAPIPTTVQTRLDDYPTVPGAGTLSYTDGLYTVTLTRFWYAVPSVYSINRVSNYSTTGGWSDDVGQFTLSVTSSTAVPEPGALALLAGMCISGIGFQVCRRRSR